MPLYFQDRVRAPCGAYNENKIYPPPIDYIKIKPASLKSFAYQLPGYCTVFYWQNARDKVKT